MWGVRTGRKEKKRDKKEIVRLCVYVWMGGSEWDNTCKVSVCVCVGEEEYR